MEIQYGPLDASIVSKAKSSLQEALKDFYHNCVDIESNIFDVNIGNPDNIQTKFQKSFTGLQFESKDKRNFCRITAGALSYHQLANYRGFDNFISFSKDTFPRILKLIDVNTILNIKMRYLNLLKLPDSVKLEDLQKYFTFGIFSSDGDSKVVKTFRSQLVESLDGDRVFVSRVITPEGSNASKIILDLTVINNTTIIGDFGSTNVFDIIDELRRIKNNTFESSITDASRNLFS